MNKVIYTLIAAFLIYSCDTTEKEIKIQDVVPDKSISALSDSSFFSVLPSLIWCNTRLLCSESNRSQVFVMNEELDLISVIGGIGRGPEEMSGIDYFCVYKDTIIIKDPGNDRMQFFNFKGNHLGYIKGIDTTPARYLRKFVYENGMFVTTAKNDSAIIIYNAKTGKTTKFGERYHFNSEIQNRIRNDRYIFKKGDTIISVSDNQPFIEDYDFKGNLLNTYDYSNIDLIKKELLEISKQKLSERSYSVLIADCDIYEDNIFLLINSHKDGFCSNIVLRFIYNKNIKLCNIYRLKDDIYRSIVFNGTFLYAFSNTTGELQRFRL